MERNKWRPSGADGALAQFHAGSGSGLESCEFLEATVLQYVMLAYITIKYQLTDIVIRVSVLSSPTVRDLSTFGLIRL